MDSRRTYTTHSIDLIYHNLVTLTLASLRFRRSLAMDELCDILRSSSQLEELMLNRLEFFQKPAYSYPLPPSPAGIAQLPHLRCLTLTECGYEWWSSRHIVVRIQSAPNMYLKPRPAAFEGAAEMGPIISAINLLLRIHHLYIKCEDPYPPLAYNIVRDTAGKILLMMELVEDDQFEVFLRDLLTIPPSDQWH
ncbi:hypothetical protein BOTBODRAFT_188845 [Botryobasidium botryosum FD-172 SS1]|uniref:Uncharacterized protein n=1 Tax=Botryobasidium botryosum (strain FD-172 SS1) TaxID=930990 RepID=A0A067MMI6_BOTB1|nr:hypothetical protein BOTBODRAFT_188845 [Botryobasidium botryosum FD-172 SS1]